MKKVIKCDGGDGNGFAVGDNDAGNWNSNEAAWNDTKRMLSFWSNLETAFGRGCTARMLGFPGLVQNWRHTRKICGGFGTRPERSMICAGRRESNAVSRLRGGFSPAYVCVSTSAGSRFLCYYTTTGTDFLDGSGNVNVYLGWPFGSGTQWRRFERDVAADWARVAGSSPTWQNTDGILFRPTNHANYDLYIDEIRFSNSITIEHNLLIPGVVAQIATQRQRPAATTPGGGQGGGSGSTGQTDTWLHYDHIGNVLLRSNTSGAQAEAYTQDAWGNVLANTTTGEWITAGQSGLYHQTRRFDNDTGLVDFWLRGYLPAVGIFDQKSPYPPSKEHQYNYVSGNPVGKIDAYGDLESIPEGNFCGPETRAIWKCNRYLKIVGHYGPQIGSASHTYICCQGYNRGCFGFGPDVGQGDLIPPEHSATGTCEKFCVPPARQYNCCNQPKARSDYSLPKYNCHDQAKECIEGGNLNHPGYFCWRWWWWSCMLLKNQAAWFDRRWMPAWC